MQEVLLHPNLDESGSSQTGGDTTAPAVSISSLNLRTIIHLFFTLSKLHSFPGPPAAGRIVFLWITMIQMALGVLPVSAQTCGSHLLALPALPTGGGHPLVLPVPPLQQHSKNASTDIPTGGPCSKQKRKYRAANS